MQQLPLIEASGLDIDHHILRKDDVLSIPEGLDTIPFTHGLHRFPGKFIPNVVRYLLKTTLPNSRRRVVYDPFCGSGTTLVEAALAGRPFVGRDLDPLSIMMSKAKTTPLEISQINELGVFWDKHDFTQDNQRYIPDVPNLSHWFSESAIEELSSIKARCEQLPTALALFSLIVFSSIIRRVSNADDQTQKTYVSHTLPKNPPLPSQLFPIFMERALKGMMAYTVAVRKPVNGVVLRGDSRHEGTSVEFHDILTSPPYIDSIDYVYNQLLEYYWLMTELGFDSYQDVRAFRNQPMGAVKYSLAELQQFDTKKYLNGMNDTFNVVCKEIGKKSPKEERVVRSFFLDFIKHIISIRQRQRAGGYYICIIGNSYIRGVTVPTVTIMSELFKACGYSLNDKFSYEIRRHYMKFPRRSNSGKIKTDYVLVFRCMK